MTRTILVAALAAVSVFANVGCATKKYVRNQVTPINNKLANWTKSVPRIRATSKM